MSWTIFETVGGNSTFSLGLDLSTQSLSAVLLQGVLGSAASRAVGSWSLRFADCASDYQLDAETLCLASEEPNFYAQPPGMFLRCLDRLFALMQADGAPLAQIAVINCAVQQHGQLWLCEGFDRACDSLAAPPSSHASMDGGLERLFAQSYAYPAAPIWLCSQTAAEAQLLCERLQVGRNSGQDALLQHSGSAAPLRFSGLVLRWLALRQPAAYGQTRRIHLLSSWLAAVLSGQSAAATDWGSGSGTSLMDYRRRQWSAPLLQALAADLPGGAEALQQRLPQLCSPLALAGQVAPYFGRYGLPTSCKVLVGSGDNPQSKVCSPGDLFSLGSSLVMMSQAKQARQVEAASPLFHPWANAMYDGLGRPFSFACRSNGALVWDHCRRALGLDFAAQEQALARYPLGTVSAQSFHLLAESFPPQPASSSPFHPALFQDPGKHLVALIDGALLEMQQACELVFAPSQETLSLTGGAAKSVGICQRIAEIWQRPVQVLGEAGAACGAAQAGLVGLANRNK